MKQQICVTMIRSWLGRLERGLMQVHGGRRRVSRVRDFEAPRSSDMSTWLLNRSRGQPAEMGA